MFLNRLKQILSDKARQAATKLFNGLISPFSVSAVLPYKATSSLRALLGCTGSYTGVDHYYLVFICGVDFSH